MIKKYFWNLESKITSKFNSHNKADNILIDSDLKGLTIMVTGADSGIGFETARSLAAKGARIYIGSLSDKKGNEASDKILNLHPNSDINVISFDLGNISEIRDKVGSFKEEKLDVLICNAGIYGGSYSKTVDGFERTIGVCYIGHFILVMLLLNKLKASKSSRIVIVSSENHRYPKKFNIDDLLLTKENYSEIVAYGHAKKCLILFANEFNRRYSESGITANSLHPGNLISTGIDKNSLLLRIAMLINRPFSRTPHQAASTSVWLATSKELEGIGGKYFVNCSESNPAKITLDKELASELWKRTEQLIEKL